jgi:hypothetical protein
LNTYYDYIDEIWKLSYKLSLQIHISKCQWVKYPQGVELDEYDFTLIDLNNVGDTDEKHVGIPGLDPPVSS